MNFSIIEELLPNDMLGKDLYHYTTSDGLLGILKSRKLHCSHIFYLNDYEENLNAWKYYFKLVETWKHDDQKGVHFAALLKNQFEHWKIFNSETISLEAFAKFRINEFYLFVFSLSRMDDDLTQWRAYTDDSIGFGIKFNFNEGFLYDQSRFKEPRVASNYANCKLLIRNCIYNTKEKEEIIKKLIDRTFEDYKNGKGNWPNELFFNMLSLNIFFKNDKFESEQECRVAVLPETTILFTHDKEAGSLHFKNGKSFLIPYIEMDLTANILKEVKIGPTPFPNHSLASISMLLKKYDNKYGPITTTLSRIPYRSW